MPTISKNMVNGVVYDLMDEQARTGIDNIKAALTRDVEIAFRTSSTYPTGWRVGYFYGTEGEVYSLGSSNYYLRHIYKLSVSGYPELYGALFLTVTPPEGYAVRVTEIDDNTNVIIKHYGQINTTTNPEYAGLPISVPFNSEHAYLLSLGRFPNSDAGDYNTETFINSIKVVASISVAITSNKRDRTGDFEWFSVDVKRPTAFGGEETGETTETVECVLRLPSSYTSQGKPTRLVLACHGASGYIEQASEKWYNDSWKAFMDQLLAAGYAVFDANIFEASAGTALKGSAYGSPLYVDVLKKAYDYIQQNYNVTDKIFCHGTSMGGVGATAFAHVYPQIVLAESSFAGRDVLRYIAVISGQFTDATSLGELPAAFGYATLEELTGDQFSHVIGGYPSLSLIKYVDGAAVIPPDRVTDFQNWMEYYTAPALLSRDDDPGVWMGKRTVPYKSWNSWADNEHWTKLEEVLSEAYNRGGSCPYYAVSYETGSHSQMSYGTINDMIPQLIQWYKRWE